MSTRTKYPRTSHLPWSPGMTSDDRMLSEKGLAILSGVDTVVTEKMDGGNVTLMRDCFYARSVDSGTLPWEKMAKSMWAQIAHDIPDGWRISAESMWARRSVAYTDLESPLLIIGVWNENDTLLSWDEIVEWSQLLGLPTVPFIGKSHGVSDAYTMWVNHVKKDSTGKWMTEDSEGFVVRDAAAFPANEFSLRVGKWVRANHVRTDANWRHRDDFAVNGFMSKQPCAKNL